MNRNFVSAFTIVVMLFSVFFIIQCSNITKIDNKEPHYADLDTNVHYVGMTECRTCHQSIYETFIRTGMGLSINQASKQKSSAKFDEHALVYDKFKDFYYKPFWKNDSLEILEFRLNKGDTVYQRIEKISYIIGSGQHTNSHIYNVNGYLYQAPLTFYTQQGKWDLPPGFENGNNSRFNRIIGLECLSCHNGYPEIIPGSENKYAFVPNGIDCERCHGPGSRHVTEKKAGKIVDVSKEIDYSIVNPAKLPIDLQFDVCQRCHIQGNAVLREGKSFYDFKPGMKLSDVMNVFMPVYSGRTDEHIMASHAERLKQSKCFIKTTEKINGEGKFNLALKPYEEGLTCVTCHNPHVSRLETPKESFNNSCVNCHAVGKKKKCSEKENVLRNNNNNCVGCHMPENKTADIPHVRIHDHRIMIPVSEEEKKKVKKLIGIVAINNTNPDRETVAKAYINYFEKFGYDPIVLDSALKYISMNDVSEINKNIRSIIHVYFLKKEYDKVVEYVKQCNNVLKKFNDKSYDNDDAWTCYRIAESYNNIGDAETALVYYKQAYSLAPLDPRFSNEYAQHLAMKGRYQEASVLFETIIKMQPLYAPPYCNLGYLYLSVHNDVEKANQLNESALALDPDYEAALMNKAAILLITKKSKEAIKIINRVLKINPENVKAKLAIKQIGKS